MMRMRPTQGDDPSPDIVRRIPPFLACPAGLIFLFVAAWQPAVADVPDIQRGEVAHLLAYVRDSGCTFIRNGAGHDAAEAYAHIRRKYDYFRTRIASTEEFIEYAASRSLVSGRDYRVRCGAGGPVRLRDWLLRELERYRRAEDQGRP